MDPQIAMLKKVVENFLNAVDEASRYICSSEGLDEFVAEMLQQASSDVVSTQVMSVTLNDICWLEHVCMEDAKDIVKGRLDA